MEVSRLREAQPALPAQNACTVADPTGTPLNVRATPAGQLLPQVLYNGTNVFINQISPDARGKSWALVGRPGGSIFGWVFRDYINCEVANASPLERAAAPQSPYVVDGLALNGQVRFDSQAYRQYQCSPSDKFPGYTWCHKEKKERTSRGEITSSNSILHIPDGTAVYVNRYIEPAFFAPNDVQSEIERLSAKFGERPRLVQVPRRIDFWDALIALWGQIQLEPLDPSEISTVASGGAIRGLLVSFLGDLQRSPKRESLFTGSLVVQDFCGLLLSTEMGAECFAF